MRAAGRRGRGDCIVMRWIFWAFTLLILLVPFPFGGVYEITQAWFACLVLILAVVLCIHQMQNRSGEWVSVRRVGWEAAAFMAVIGWAIFQMLPVTPVELHHPLWAEAGRALHQSVSGAISLSPGSGYTSLMRMVTYGAVFWLALQLGRDRQQARIFLDAFILAGTMYAVYGIIMNFEGFQKILWADKKAVGCVTGTFVNRNNFATYMGMVLLCAVGAYVFRFREAAMAGRRGRDRLVAFLYAAFVQGSFRIASILILSAALMLTASRAGVIFSVSALMVLLASAAIIRSVRRGRTGPMTWILLAALVISMAATSGHFLDRISKTTLAHQRRMDVYELAWQAVRDAPWTGFGLGSFSRAFPLYADIENSQMDKAHNDWLEMIFDLGWPAALLWFGVLASLAVRCLTGFFRRQRDNVYPLVAFCAALLVGLHGLVDFSLQIPAVAAGFAALLGVGVAQSYSSQEE